MGYSVHKGYAIAGRSKSIMELSGSEVSYGARFHMTPNVLTTTSGVDATTYLIYYNRQQRQTQQDVSYTISADAAYAVLDEASAGKLRWSSLLERPSLISSRKKSTAVCHPTLGIVVDGLRRLLCLEPNSIWTQVLMKLVGSTYNLATPTNAQEDSAGVDSVG